MAVTIPASAQQPSYSIEERPVFAVATSNPITEVANWGPPDVSPSPKPFKRLEPRITQQAAQTSAPSPKPPARLGSSTTRGNCVATLKAAGLLPNRKVTKDGRAATIPIKPLDMKEGEKAVVRTTEGRLTGHVVYVQKVGGNYVSQVEGGFPGGVGRIVPPHVIQGEVSL